MEKTFVSNFLDSMYENNRNFIEVLGTEKLFDPKFMLIADTVSEDMQLFTDVILAQLQEHQIQNARTVLNSSVLTNSQN